MNPQHVWQTTLARIQLCVSVGAFTIWFRGTLRLELRGATLTVVVGSTFACEHLRQRFGDVARVALSETLGRPAHVVFLVQSATTTPTTSTTSNAASARVPAPTRPTPQRSTGAPPVRAGRVTHPARRNVTYDTGPAYAAHVAPTPSDHPGAWYAQPPLLGADAQPSSAPAQWTTKSHKQAPIPAEVKRGDFGAPLPAFAPRRALITPRLLEAGGSSATHHALHTHYRFETFVVGLHNRLAYAAAQEVTRAPGLSYNPLVICGDAGLGKTHLLQAIGHQANAAGLRVIYVTAEQFTTELVEAIHLHTTEDFRQRYRAVDVLLMDDVQLIAGREATEEEFFHTFNWLHEANKQIVLGSDCAPQAMRRLHDRLRSRFSWGLIADIQPPDAPCRVDIVQAKAHAQQLDIGDEAIAALARPPCASVRELEGRLTRVVAYARLLQRPLDAALVTQALAPLASSGASAHEGAEQMGRSFHMLPGDNDVVGRPLPVASVSQTLKAVARRYGVAVEALLGKSREHQVAWARQVAMYLLREVTSASLFQIGAQLGGRDHTTIMHGCARVSQALSSDARLRDDIAAIRRELVS